MAFSSDKELFFNQTLFVVVIYNSKFYDCETWKTLLKFEKNDIFVYDNSPIRQHEIADFSPNITYVADNQNSGLSVAYNEAAKHAERCGKNWLLLLDQDTSFPTGGLDCYFNSLSKYPEVKMFVPLLVQRNGSHFSPTCFNRSCFYSLKPKLGLNSLDEFAPVNSGLLVELKAFKAVGGYNDAVRLDFADFQFIERFSKLFSEFILVDLVAKQDFSNNEKDCKKLYNRFLLYCESALYCHKKNYWQSLYYCYVVFRHTLALTRRTKRMLFLQAFVLNYLLPSVISRELK